MRFALPETVSLPAEEIDRSRLAGKSVLVVDDNATNRRILKQCLQSWGMKPTAVLSARAALEELERASAEAHPFSLVLLDAAMPKMDGFELARQIQSNRDVALPAVMMLSSADRPGDIARCRDLGMVAYLTKPVAASDLMSAIVRALGQGAVERASAPPPTTAPPPRTLRILVADDNAANRVLAARVLQKRGHEVVSVASGREVLEALRQDRFDLILLDVQMPKMDGFATTAAIREQEKDSGQHIPIVAMTAYAMSGDRERCLEAGMDAYVAKPLHARQLQKLVEGLAAASPEQPPDRSEPQASLAHFDFGPALARLEGDVELLREQMRFFLQDAPALVSDIGAAIGRSDGKGLQLAAHRLKGLISSFDDRDAMEAAQRLERMGRSDDFSEAGTIHQQLQLSLNRLTLALEAFLHKGRKSVVESGEWI